MLSRLGGEGCCVKEDSAGYGIEEIDFDTDPDRTISRQADAPRVYTDRPKWAGMKKPFVHRNQKEPDT